MAHDAIRAATLLREIFANDRTRVGFLIGAGCPYSIPKPKVEGEAEVEGWVGLIPDVAGLTGLALQRLEAEKPELCETLKEYLKSQSLANANIEVILSKVRALLDIVGASTFHQLDKASLSEIEKNICGTIAKAVSLPLPEGDNGYRSVSSWIKGLTRQHPVEIFTTNYDLLLESALEDNQVSTFDGFTGSRRPFFDVAAIERGGLPPDWVRVWKLHGSVNWRETEESQSVYRVCDLDKASGSVIHPSHKKYDQSRRLPYLALMDRLKSFVRQASAVLFVSGYSFGDEHINEVMVEGLENNPTAVVIAAVHGKLAGYPELVKLAKKSANLTVMAADRAIVGKKLDVWTYNPEQGTGSLKSIFEEPPREGWDAGTIRFQLGDFAAFGGFLDDVSGSFRRVERVVQS